MTFSQYAGTAIVPTLARIVLAATFVCTGYNKIFKYAEFDAAQAAQLHSLNADVNPPAGQPPATSATAPSEAATTAPATAPAPLTGTFTARSLHTVTLLLHHNNFPYPKRMAQLAALTELIGGSMLLLGLFSRIWGLGLSIVMGCAFYLVSMKINGIFTMHPFTFADNITNFNTAVVQMSLFVLAFGVLLTGPGPLSIDRMLFGGGEPEAEARAVAKID
jgi:uncharacterized membrane protein YphA (DoxX/SURF4 family)